jgi:hypothetical protein
MNQPSLSVSKPRYHGDYHVGIVPPMKKPKFGLSALRLAVGIADSASQ